MSKMAQANLNEEWKNYQSLKQNLEDHLLKLYTKLWGQCAPQMQSKVATHKEYQDIELMCSVLKLLSIIDEVCEGRGSTNKYWKLQHFLGRRRLLAF